MLGWTEGEHSPDPEENNLPPLPAVMGAATVVKKAGTKTCTFKMVVVVFLLGDCIHVYTSE